MTHGFVATAGGCAICKGRYAMPTTRPYLTDMIGRGEILINADVVGNIPQPLKAVYSGETGWFSKNGSLAVH
jgi:hypothetical protein